MISDVVAWQAHDFFEIKFPYLIQQNETQIAA